MNKDDDDKEIDPSWLELNQPRQWSRLLYTNPVCFLGTVDAAADKNHQRHVMVVTWLTATNNDGHFIMSLHRRRHTVSVLLRNMLQDDELSDHATKAVGSNNTSSYYSQRHEQLPQCPPPTITSTATAPVEFSLSVPVQGMEDLVLGVGGTSGRWGSKFPRDYYSPDDEMGDDNDDFGREDDVAQEGKKRQKHQPRFPFGIPGLSAVPLGHGIAHTDSDISCTNTDLFAIDGTVAHLQCQIIRMLDKLVDDDHYLVLAHSRQNLFQPQHHVPPYLTFFGSQTFGYVVPTVNTKVTSITSNGSQQQQQEQPVKETDV